VNTIYTIIKVAYYADRPLSPSQKLAVIMTPGSLEREVHFKRKHLKTLNLVLTCMGSMPSQFLFPFY
jgi:hypothetical protein